MLGIKGIIMETQNDAVSAIVGHLRDQIARLSESAEHLSINQLASHVDEIRKVARDHGLGPLADIAHGLESALARSDSPVLIQSWLGVMGEAASATGTSEVWLASIGRRLYG